MFAGMLQRIAWIILALIHFFPALAMIRPALISRLYGVAAGNDIFPLLHHRAALFFVIFLLCVWSAFDPASRRVASIGVGISMVSFLIIYWSAGAPSMLKTIAIADLIGIPFLAFVTWKAFVR